MMENNKGFCACHDVLPNSAVMDLKYVYTPDFDEEEFLQTQQSNNENVCDLTDYILLEHEEEMIESVRLGDFNDSIKHFFAIHQGLLKGECQLQKRLASLINEVRDEELKDAMYADFSLKKVNVQRYKLLYNENLIDVIENKAIAAERFVNGINELVKKINQLTDIQKSLLIPHRLDSMKSDIERMIDSNRRVIWEIQR